MIYDDQFDAPPEGALTITISLAEYRSLVSNSLLAGFNDDLRRAEIEDLRKQLKVSRDECERMKHAMDQANSQTATETIRETTRHRCDV